MITKSTITASDFIMILTNWRRERMKEYFERTGSNMVNLMFEHRATGYENLDKEIDDKVSIQYQSSNKPNKEDFTIKYRL